MAGQVLNDSVGLGWREMQCVTDLTPEFTLRRDGVGVTTVRPCRRVGSFARAEYRVNLTTGAWTFLGITDRDI